MQKTVNGLPPHDISAEEAVLGACLLDSRAVDKCIVARLRPEMFFREQNGWIYDAIREASTETEVSQITVAHYLGDKLDRAGGEVFLAELAGRVLTPIGVEAHIKRVIDSYRQREVIEKAGEIAALAYADGDPVETISTGIDLLGSLLDSRDAGLQQMGMARLEDREGFNWGLPVLDRYTMGVAGGQLGIAAGASGQGKSFLAAQVARHVASQGGNVCIFTLEMSAKEYESRMAHAIAGVRKRISRYDPPLTDIEAAKVTTAQQQLWSWGVNISDKVVDATTVASAVKLLNSEKHVDFVVVDYLQILQRRDDDNEASSLKAITKTLKNLSMELDTFVFLISSMNRAALTEMRSAQGMKLDCPVTGEKFPQPFKESLMGGAVEFDADLVIQLQRHINCGENNDHIQLCVTKNRNGVEASGMLLTEFPLARFRTMTREEITTEAHGDMYRWRTLMRDQGYNNE